MTTKGWAVAAILRGEIVMRDFALTKASRGNPLRFVETLQPG